MSLTRLRLTALLIPAFLTACLFFSGCGKEKQKSDTPRYVPTECNFCKQHNEKPEGKCLYCLEEGNGVCSFCEGVGKRKVGTKDNWIEEECPFCKGSGKCHYCEGSGVCRVCDGTGKQDKDNWKR
ncbi:MAG: hypothetical protein ACLFQK_00495 [Fibrobacterota bacterium]